MSSPRSNRRKSSSVSPFKIKSPKMKKSSNKSEDRMFKSDSSFQKKRSEATSIKKKSPRRSPKGKKSQGKKVKSPIKKTKSIPHVSSKISLIESKAKNLYGAIEIPDVIITSNPLILSQPHALTEAKAHTSKKIKSQGNKCNILRNQCYIDCVNHIVNNLSNYEDDPDQLVDDIYTMIEPRMNKDIYLENVNVANLYNNMVDYTAQQWSDDDIKTIKTIVKTVKENSHYKPVKMFIKEVKFYKYN